MIISMARPTAYFCLIDTLHFRFSSKHITGPCKPVDVGSHLVVFSNAQCQSSATGGVNVVIL